MLWVNIGQVGRSKGRVASGEWRGASDVRRECTLAVDLAIMSSGNLGEFGAYRKAMELFDGVVDDMTRFLADRKSNCRAPTQCVQTSRKATVVNPRSNTVVS